MNIIPIPTPLNGGLDNLRITPQGLLAITFVIGLTDRDPAARLRCMILVVQLLETAIAKGFQHSEALIGEYLRGRSNNARAQGFLNELMSCIGTAEFNAIFDIETTTREHNA